MRRSVVDEAIDFLVDRALDIRQRDARLRRRGQVRDAGDFERERSHIDAGDRLIRVGEALIEA